MALSLLLFHSEFVHLMRSTFSDAYLSYIPLVLPLTAWLLWAGRKTTFNAGVRARWPGAILLPAGLYVYFAAGKLVQAAPALELQAIRILGIVAVWLAGFILCYGAASFRAAEFPLLFLLFLIPPPPALLARMMAFLQQTSAGVAHSAFSILGEPVMRQGYVFYLHGTAVEVASECSGIRSFLVLFIVALLGGHMFLRSAWARILLALLILPLAIVKNGLRITALTLVAAHLDPSVLDSELHRSGGIPLFVLSLVVLCLVIRWLRRLERPAAPTLVCPVHCGAEIGVGASPLGVN
jgi:exosortase